MLKARGVRIGGRRTTMRLEPVIWQSLDEISEQEGYSVHELCTRIAARKPTGGSLSAAVRSFVINYYRDLATEPADAAPPLLLSQSRQ